MLLEPICREGRLAGIPSEEDLRKLAKEGAVCGMAAGILTVLIMLVFTKVVAEPVDWIDGLGRTFDTGFIGCVINAIVFAVVSTFTTKLPEAHVQSFIKDSSES